MQFVLAANPGVCFLERVDYVKEAADICDVNCCFIDETDDYKKLSNGQEGEHFSDAFRITSCAGRYRILRRLGVGYFVLVWLDEHVSSQEAVVMNIFRGSRTYLDMCKDEVAVLKGMQGV